MTNAMVGDANAATTSVPDTRWVIPNRRPAAVVQFEEGLVSFFVDAATLLGVPRSVAAVYGIVFASPEPLGFSEITARLNFSNGSVSQALKALREIGAIRQSDGPTVRQSTSARVSFEPDTEMRRLIQRFIDQRVETQLSRGNTRLATLHNAASVFPAADRKVLEQRLFKLRRWHARTRALMPVIRSFLKLARM